MLILAGVSINAVVGDNGILNKATDAVFLQSTAILEEYFNQLYATCAIDGNIDGETPLDTIIKNGYQNYFFSTSEGYCLKRSIKNEETGVYENLVFYLIRKEQLPIDLQKQLQGGNASKTLDFRKLNDVYGITSDLKAYYISGGIDTMLGLSRTDLNADSPDIVAFEKDSQLAQMVNGGTEAITNQGLKTIKSLTIDSEEELVVLKEFNKFSNISQVYFQNINIENLDGIEGAFNTLNYIKFIDCEVQNYSALCGLSNLTYLYLVRPVGKNADVSRLCSTDKGIAMAEFSKLQYFGIVGDDRYIQTTTFNWGSNKYEITDISPLVNLSKTTKEAIKFMYLQHLQLNSIAALEDFKNIYLIRLEFNRLATLEGIQNMHNLTYLFAAAQTSSDLGDWNGLGAHETDVATNNDALRYIYKNSSGNNTTLKYVDLRYQYKLKHIEYLSSCTAIKLLYIDNCRSLINVNSIANVLAQCGTNYKINAQYGTSLISNKSKVLSLAGTVTVDQFETLMNNTNLTHLALQSLVLKTNTGVILNKTTSPTYDEEITKVLSTCKNLKYLQLYNLTYLTSINFIDSGKVTNLIELDLRNSKSVNDLSNLNTYATNLKSLSLNNDNIQLTTIQTTLNRLRANVSGATYWYSHAGCNLLSWNLIKQLEDCTELEYWHNWEVVYNYVDKMDEKTLDLTRTKLKDVYIACYICKVKYPNTLTNFYEFWGSLPIFSENSDKLTHVKINNANLQDLYTAENWKELAIDMSKKIPNLNVLEVDNDANFKFEHLTYMSNLTKLNTFIYSTEYTNTKYPNFDQEKVSLQGIGSLINLTNVVISNTRNLRDLGDLENCTNLKELQINDTALVNISALNSLSNLQVLTMYNNAIKDIYPILNCKKLEVVDLRNNLLSDMAYHNTGNGSVGYDTLDIFYSLNQNVIASETLDGISGSLKSIKLKGNNFTDTDIIKSVEWETDVDI